ncbi:MULTISPECIES: hypothetical protein [Butyricimonas]|jgi:hypothetical protein|uniref:Uncharacterized protein n=1 Tax=Butyricimonas faecihominis TaxID=1472416 RepID=A0A7W6MXW7_9BACT|nr:MULTISPECIES: hypothetical protein [Butyricimonas]KAB1508559.1 hypothetical protein F8R21_02920 [Butyricimonas faecihominis]MBB4025442.1 hypothetical protein [Butyricimonas faecihominis]WOF08675.1 hypothetical protein F1611_09880 [Butyricimonas faecihominis]WOF10456.1 hypothetical protein F1611_19750 [Butyricimonas faecihominis]BEI55169.1 hypothetical protein Bfae18676_01440 [Butyricimonas faecihominis]
MMNVRLRGFQSHKVGHSKVKEKMESLETSPPKLVTPRKDEMANYSEWGFKLNFFNIKIMNEKIQEEIGAEQIVERAEQVAKVETKEEVMENPDKKEEVAQEQVEETTAEQSPAPVTGMDRIKEAIARMTKIEIKPFYNINYSKKYEQLKRHCAYKPVLRITTAKDAGENSLFWIGIGEAETIKLPLKANSESFLSLLRYIQEGVLDDEVDFNNSDFDGMEEDWEIMYLKSLGSKKCDFTIYYGNKQNVYLSYKSQFGVLTFNLKEEGETKYLLSQLLSK